MDKIEAISFETLAYNITEELRKHDDKYGDTYYKSLIEAMYEASAKHHTPQSVPGDVVEAMVSAFVKEYFTKNEGWEHHCMQAALNAAAEMGYTLVRTGDGK